MDRNPYESPRESASPQANDQASGRPWFWQPFHPLTLTVVGVAVVLVPFAFVVAVWIFHPR